MTRLDSLPQSYLDRMKMKQAPREKVNKYNNEPTLVKGTVFQSKKEGARYAELLLLQQGKVISNLEIQPVFTLLEAFTDSQGIKHRPILYKADYSYLENGRKVVEDVKGMKLEAYRIKKKLFIHKYPYIIFREIL